MSLMSAWICAGPAATALTLISTERVPGVRASFWLVRWPKASVVGAVRPEPWSAIRSEGGSCTARPAFLTSACAFTSTVSVACSPTAGRWSREAVTPRQLGGASECWPVVRIVQVPLFAAGAADPDGVVVPNADGTTTTARQAPAPASATRGTGRRTRLFKARFRDMGKPFRGVHGQDLADQIRSTRAPLCGSCALSTGVPRRVTTQPHRWPEQHPG